MNSAARSVVVFGWYLVVLGFTLLTSPNALLSVFGLVETREVWIRVVGMLTLLLAVYYIDAGRRNVTSFIRLTVLVRASVIVFFGIFVARGWAPPTLLLFGGVDLAGAAWTRWALGRGDTAR